MDQSKKDIRKNKKQSKTLTKQKDLKKKVKAIKAPKKTGVLKHPEPNIVNGIDELDQYKINDLLTLEARSGAAFWYGEIWKTVNKCVFCDLRNRYVITELDGMVLTVNLYPYIDGNLMIVPRRHVIQLNELTNKEWDAVRALQYAARKLLKAIFGFENLWLLYREGVLGSKSNKTVDHLHIHLFPYEEGLVEWHYKKVRIPPFEVAAIFRDNKNVIEQLIEKYKFKYGKAK